MTHHRHQALRVLLAALALLLLAPQALRAKQKDDTSPYFFNAAERDSLTLNPELCARKTVWTNNWEDVPDQQADYYRFQNDPKYGNMYIRRLKNRRALAGDGCMVNHLIQEVAVGAWSDNMGALTDEDLNNYATFPTIIRAAVTVNPIVGIRDVNNYYTRGTQAGFCLVASSGSTVLQLDVVKVWTIGFYRDGHFLGTKTVGEGQSGEGISLKLVQIPGSTDANIMLTAESDWLFDEVTLNPAGGVQANVGEILKIKYAFIGDSFEYTMTDGGIARYNSTIAQSQLGHIQPQTGDGLRDGMKGWNPVLLGIPFPMTKKEVRKMTDDDLSNGAALTPILGVAYMGGAKFMMENTDDSHGEAFGPGFEVGFNMGNGSALELGLGTWVRLILFDRNGETVQEETVEAGVLGLTLGAGGNFTASITSQQPFSGCEVRLHGIVDVNLGGKSVHYAFVRPKPDVIHHCHINPSGDTDLCEVQSTLQLRSNPQVSVRWSLTEAEFYDEPDADGNPPSPAPAHQLPSISESGYVTNLSPGWYTFRATAADGCWDETRISVGTAFAKRLTDGTTLTEGCGWPLVNGVEQTAPQEYEASSKIYESSGALISVSDLRDKENIVSADYDAYATYVGGLGVADNLCLGGVKKKSGYIYDATDRHDGETTEEAVARQRPLRVGFVVENHVTGLDVDLLQFMQIRCYNGEDKVYTHVISESNAVSAGLGGSDSMQKVRYTITIPATDDDGNPMQVTEFQLWKSGVLTLSASNLRIFYAFVEDAATDCNDELGCSTTLMSARLHHASINADGTKMAGGVSVANVWNNLSHMVDGDRNSSNHMVNSVSVGNVNTLAISLGRTYDYHHQLGFLLENNTYVANVKVGNWLKAETYLNGQPTGDESTDWKVLGADVAGYGAENYIFIQPIMPYDEVRLQFGNSVTALDVMEFKGVFVRNDVDNDGLPDCKDPAPCNVEAPELSISDVCVGDRIVVTGKGPIGVTYHAMFSEPGVAMQTTVSSVLTGEFTFQYTTAQPGQYALTVYDGSMRPVCSYDYMVHPTQTTWRTNAASQDWNNWTNWTNGTPYCCTDVVIPSGAVRYPRLLPADIEVTQLDDGTTLRTVGDENCCQGIHFEPVAQVENVTWLNYERAWVSFELPANEYHSISAPLHSVYSGDMFIPEAMHGRHDAQAQAYFTPLNAASCPQNRFDPSVYQRMWATNGTGVRLGSTTEEIHLAKPLESYWTREFNFARQLYAGGKGMSLWVDNGELPEQQSFLFRLPKEHTTYNYYNKNTHDQYDKAETITRDRPYRFVYEEADALNPTFQKSDANHNYQRTVYAPTAQMDVTLTAERTDNPHGLDDSTPLAGTNYFFLMGNPYMARLDLYKFLQANKEHVAAVVFSPNPMHSAAENIAVGITQDGTQVAGLDVVKSLVPLQGAFIETRLPSTSQTIHFTPDMTLPTEDAVAAAPALRLSLAASSTGGQRRTASMLLTGATSEPMRAETLFDSEVQPSVALFAMTQGKAWAISPAADTISLGLILAQSAAQTDTVRFTVHTNSRELTRGDYELLDRETGLSYPLDVEIAIPGVRSSLGRFALISQRPMGQPTGLEPAVLSQGVRHAIVTLRPGTATVLPQDREVRLATLHDLQGRLIAETVATTRQAREGIVLATEPGVCVLQVLYTDGTTDTFKMLAQ